MRRWNGWGEQDEVHPLPEGGEAFLTRVLGRLTPPEDVSLDAVLSLVPESRLGEHPLITTTPLDRLTHSRGQSFPDLVALRSGDNLTFTDGVAYPESDAEARALLDYAADAGARVIPFGGGTSVVGHVTPEAGENAVLTIDMRRLSQLRDVDRESALARIGAGATGPLIEAQLRAHGLTLGHFPQSYEYSTLGGWIATRSSGQQSLGFGRIEHLMAGARVESPSGSVAIRPFPASATGPDLRELLLGSEGRMGLITEATVRARPLPERERFEAIFFPDWDDALEATRRLARLRMALSMVRTSSPRETETTLLLSGHPRMVRALKTWLRLRGAGEGRCLSIVGITGSELEVAMTLGAVRAITKRCGGVVIGERLGRQWERGRFRGPHLRNTLWAHGVAVDTVESATSWSNVQTLLAAMERALERALADRGERVYAFTHLSHVYPTGSSIYTTFLFRLGPEPAETLDRWHALKRAASEAILAGGGTISHQHGIGRDHAAYLRREKGALAVEAINAALETFDPDGIMNPGALPGG